MRPGISRAEPGGELVREVTGLPEGSYRHAAALARGDGAIDSGREFQVVGRGIAEDAQPGRTAIAHAHLAQAAHTSLRIQPAKNSASYRY